MEGVRILSIARQLTIGTSTVQRIVRAQQAA